VTSGTRRPRIVIIGAGMGGLVAALLLAGAGGEVTVLERSGVSGGKLRELEVAGLSIDSGPTVLTMVPTLERIFAEVGEHLADHLTLDKAAVLARHHFEDGTVFDLNADPDVTAIDIARLFGQREADGFNRFRAHAADIFRTLERSFLDEPEPGIATLVMSRGAGGLPALWRMRAFSSLWAVLCDHFSDPRLRQLFGRYATYSGASPFRAPGPLALIAHVEQSGVWLARNGMRSIATALESLAVRRGAVFRHGCEVDRILTNDGRVTGAATSDGDTFDADAVIMNGDAAALGAGLLGDAARIVAGRWPAEERSLSALTFSVAGAASGFPLLHHNVFFSGDYPAEFDDIFRRRRLPRQPTIYLCAQDRCAEQPLRDGAIERFFLIVNAPADGDRNPPSATDIETCLTSVTTRLAQAGLTLDWTNGACRTTTPADFDRMFPGTGGALYGRSCHGPMAAFQRPTARTALPGLYLAGGSVHPGPGLPMAALSGRHAAHAAIRDFGLTAPCLRTVMPGGMSTPSPTTGVMA
jgi:1-hydroxycarotenoid 3,4-desaturase